MDLHLHGALIDLYLHGAVIDEEILICCKKLDRFLANGWIVTQDHIVVLEVGCC